LHQSVAMTKTNPGGKVESERRSATVSADMARPRSTSTLMPSGMRHRQARSFSSPVSRHRQVGRRSDDQLVEKSCNFNRQWRRGRDCPYATKN
jgi:hypothetical protein